MARRAAVQRREELINVKVMPATHRLALVLKGEMLRSGKYDYEPTLDEVIRLALRKTLELVAKSKASQREEVAHG